jgi:hypothetical protein
MKFLIASLLVIATLLFACNSSIKNKERFSLFTTDSIPKKQYTIDNTKDTLLHTLNGSWLKIEKGSFNTATNNVTLEIKEALSVEQIIKAGLSTESNGKPLSSGGMIYINVKEENVTIAKPIKVALPTTFTNPNMQLFKGKETNGQVNWDNPTPLKENAETKLLNQGKALYEAKCSNCHAIGKEGSFGPDLANIYKRFGNAVYGEGVYLGFGHYFKKVYYPYTVGYTDNNKKVEQYDFANGHIDPYICNLIKLYKDSAVDLSDSFNIVLNKSMNLQNVYDFIQNESDNKNLPYPKHAYLDKCADSCRIYNELKNSRNTKVTLEKLKREQLINENGSMIENINMPNDNLSEPETLNNEQIINQPPPQEFSDKVDPERFTSQYYQFEIETFGWFNIDVLIENVDGVKKSELFVRVQGIYQERVSISLIIPSAKINVQGGKADNGDYAFYEKSGSILLPQNRKAYILAVTESGGTLAYAVQEFITNEKQTFAMELKAASKEEFSKAVKRIEIDGLSIKVAGSKNAIAIREADKQIEKLNNQLNNIERYKPKNCDCDCGSELLPDKASKVLTQMQSEPILADEDIIRLDKGK